MIKNSKVRGTYRVAEVSKVIPVIRARREDATVGTSEAAERRGTARRGCCQRSVT